MIKSERLFKLWHFSVSHGQLLLRSPKGGALAHNVDIVFVGVRYIKLPAMLKGIASLQPADPSVLEMGLTVGDGETAYVLKSGNQAHLIVAAGCKVYENDLDIFETGLEWVAAP